jgi:cyclopropane fatty-acyl-phospholipid synthase-like methyltransferase
MESQKSHWENVFATKTPNQVSWTQQYPKTSIDYLRKLHLPKTANIIDVGGGDSKFVDALLEEGYENIWVLDISELALERAKQRLGANAEVVHWVVSDIVDFKPEVQFNFWHDRAAFHFLIDDKSIATYVATIENTIVKGGNFLLGTFSENGPVKCSGLEIRQYSEATMKKTFDNKFEALECFRENHQTPFDTVQSFQFCGFKKK